MDKRTRYLLDRAVAGFTSGQDGRIYVDELGPAVYRIEPAGSECVALACPDCMVVTIKPGAPRLAALAIVCSSCGRAWDCRPPAPVVAFGQTGLVIATGPTLH